VKGEPGIIGVMLESFLVDGRQDFAARTALTPGQSITDACMGWDMTIPVLRDLAAAVRTRRATITESARVAPSAQSA
jgi:3-deoxy-7-phosphoheptulonate synthase